MCRASPASLSAGGGRWLTLTMFPIWSPISDFAGRNLASALPNPVVNVVIIQISMHDLIERKI